MSRCSSASCRVKVLSPRSIRAHFRKEQKGCLISEGWGGGLRESPSCLCLLHIIMEGEGRAEPAEPVRREDNCLRQSKGRRASGVGHAALPPHAAKWFLLLCLSRTTWPTVRLRPPKRPPHRLRRGPSHCKWLVRCPALDP